MKTTRNIRSLRSQGFTLIELLVVISIIAILAGFALPVFAAAQKRGRLTDSLSNAKQIGTALKMYAGDNGGSYPTKDSLDATLVGQDSNKALELLLGKYSSSKKIFGNKGSFYTANAVAETTATANQLMGGQNDWGYATGLTESADSRQYVVFTGTATAAGAAYVPTTSLAGGVWAGTNAIVVAVDGSAANVTLTSSTSTPPYVIPSVYGTAATPINALLEDSTNNWMVGTTVLIPLP